MDFKIYYEDSEFVGYASEAPSYGVLLVLQKRSSDGRWFITSNAPYYMYDGNEWLPAYDNDLVDHLVHNKPIEKLIVGRIVNKGLFTEIYEKAKDDRSKMD